MSDKETIREQGMIDKNYKRTSKSNFDQIKVVTNLLLLGIACLRGSKKEIFYNGASLRMERKPIEEQTKKKLRMERKIKIIQEQAKVMSK